MGQRLDVPNKNLIHRVLKRETLRSRESRFLHRLHCILLVGEGHSCYDVAGWFGVAPRTVERWVHRFQESSFEGLSGECQSGRPPKLNREQLSQLREEIGMEPVQFGYDRVRWDGKLLGTHVCDRFGITLSTRQCQRLLKEFNQGANWGSDP